MKTTYKVVGLTAFAGHKPGETFEAELTEDQERRAKQRGQLRVVRRGDNPEDEEKEAEVDG